MKLTANREVILAPLQTVSGVVERRQTQPILSNVLISVSASSLRMTATDCEVELSAQSAIENATPGETTVSARKLIDIVRALPEGSSIELSDNKGKLAIKSGRSRFSLSTLPVADFPLVPEKDGTTRFGITAAQLRKLIAKTQFAMAQQDVRYYLNGLLLEIDDSRIRAVATDGHRLSLCECEIATGVKKPIQAIVPRKGVIELQRLMPDSDELAMISIGENHIRVEFPGAIYTSKLIDGKFPDYQRVIPQGAMKKLVGDRGTLWQALHRVSILSNEKYRGVRIKLTNGMMVATANNPELEEAEEEIDVDYTSDPVEIGFNVNYILDVLAAIDTSEVEMQFLDSNSSCLIQPRGERTNRYVVMPMRL